MRCTRLATAALCAGLFHSTPPQRFKFNDLDVTIPQTGRSGQDYKHSIYNSKNPRPTYTSEMKQQLTDTTKDLLYHNQELDIPGLRQRLSRQMAEKAPRITTLDTESRLVLLLARSRRNEERMEALERGEELWQELNDRHSDLPLPSRTASKIVLCSALRRCALQCRQKALADEWTARFTERTRSLSPDDFDEQGRPGGRAAAARERARPGTGITQEDLDADADEEATQDTKRREKIGKVETVFSRFRHDVLLDHPTVQVAFRKDAGPGPRYTG
ncbi:hypothetical protein STCU_06551 [Strigomonas culicis]|uniref:Uncharacterized protein n=1 Tax=Strigomonas culicis TaxID=28005 RepID=S9U4J9_9TRYP|nr:hypothetical protein STCU_06551 [Strigomonas culicis]|eukprot:EPY25692.1 hypothetical protein STCU_06551 [Strigomonas culicis]